LPEAQLDRFMFFNRIVSFFCEEVQVVKVRLQTLNKPSIFIYRSSVIFNSDSQNPVANNVVNMRATLVSKTRPSMICRLIIAKLYRWRRCGSSCFIKFNFGCQNPCGTFNGKFSPDIEDVSGLQFFTSSIG
jgi:hypothetical protein